MRIIRYMKKDQNVQLAAVTDKDQIFELPYTDFLDIINIAKQNSKKPIQLILEIIKQSSPLNKKLDQLKLLVPIDIKEVWASGVTYKTSRDGRNYESTRAEKNTTTFYDKVYDAERPEIFFKSTKYRTVGTKESVNLRSDSNWQIPEPELGLVVDNQGEILGYTIGNDMSCRDIEGENPLYLPQAKTWKNSCSIGPAIRLAETVNDPYQFQIVCRIIRGNQIVFEGMANTSQLKRRYDELVTYLMRDNVVLSGTILLTGTAIVPPNEFSLKDGDKIEIEIPGIGVLENTAKGL